MFRISLIGDWFTVSFMDSTAGEMSFYILPNWLMNLCATVFFSLSRQQAMLILSGTATDLQQYCIFIATCIQRNYFDYTAAR